MKRTWDLRGMNLDQVIATSAKALEEISEEMIDNAGKFCRDRGGNEDEIEAAREMQRCWIEEERTGQLTKLRAWIERDGQSLN